MIALPISKAQSCLSVNWDFMELSLSLRFNGHFPGEPGLAVFIEAKDDGGGGDNWTTGATRRAKLQSNHHHQQTTILFRL